jgi:hypothetical protein
MSVGCRLAGHSVGGEQVYNSGYFFTRCRRCGDPLVRDARSGWGPPPDGHRIVWKSGWHSHSIAPDYDGLLPIAQEATPPLPALRNPFMSSSRTLMRMTPRRRAASAVGAEVELDEFPYPRLLFAAVIVGAGLKMLIDFTTGR